MGFRFRKTAKFGNSRINLSKSGIGFSTGVKGFRVTKRANGGVQTAASIPGAGISVTSSTSQKSHGCLYWCTIGWMIELFKWMFIGTWWLIKLMFYIVYWTIRFFVQIFIWIGKGIVWVFKRIIGTSLNNGVNHDEIN